MRSAEPLRKIFDGDNSVVIVDNEKLFKETVAFGGYQEYFSDMSAGDFGHCTTKATGFCPAILPMPS